MAFQEPGAKSAGLHVVVQFRGYGSPNTSLSHQGPSSWLCSLTQTCDVIITLVQFLYLESRATQCTLFLCILNFKNEYFEATIKVSVRPQCNVTSPVIMFRYVVSMIGSEYNSFIEQTYFFQCLPLQLQSLVIGWQQLTTSFLPSTFSRSLYPWTSLYYGMEKMLPENCSLSFLGKSFFVRLWGAFPGEQGAPGNFLYKGKAML